jgi:hypothetical protein
VGSVVLAALLLVPLLLRGHHHWSSHDPAARPCAACVVAQHSPAVQAPPVVPEAPAFRTFAVAGIAPRIVARLGGTPALGRAPPLEPSRAA